MKKLFTITTIAALFCAASAFGVLSWSYGWEDGTGTALGTYGNATVENSTEQAYEGTHSLKVIEDPIGGTPQIYLWWVTGLNDGDAVVVSMSAYSHTPLGNKPEARIWAHYTDSITNINDYSGSASGPGTYMGDSGWTSLTNTWIFDSNSGNNKGLVIEGRIYSDADPGNNVVYFDNAGITVSNNNAKIYNAAGDSIPEPITFGALILGFGALFLRKK
ncbi:MAG: hypothetical protein DRI44_07460 [Chlamydiae bacterium]|nr:MAG: hypothetical protein DRI44_07460 [Chlamydiota bacterium]